MDPDVKAILKALDEGGQTTDSPRALKALMDMPPSAKMRLADMLNGFYKFEPEKWHDAWLEIN